MWALMQEGYGYGMHYGGHWFGMHWGWWLFWLLLIGLGIWFVVRSSGSARAGRGAGAEEALRERYARGEISEEEFRSRMRVLRES